MFLKCAKHLFNVLLEVLPPAKAEISGINVLATGLLDIGFNILSQGRVSELVGGVGPSNHPPPRKYFLEGRPSVDMGIYLLTFLFLIFIGHTCGMQKFPSQG